MRILHLTLTLAHGGRREVIANLFDGLAQLGHSCSAGVLGDDPGPDAQRFGEVLCLERKSLFDRRAVRRLAWFCDQQQIDVIHTHDAASQFVAAFMRVRRFRKQPRMLMTFHRSLGMESACWRDRWRNTFACGMSDAVVTVSHERHGHFLKSNRIRPSKVVAIHNGIDIQRFQTDEQDRRAARTELGVSGETLVVGAVGHFGPEKGLDVVIQAFGQLRAMRPQQDLRLVIVGEGTDQQREKLQELTAPFAERVTFLGFRRDIERWFAAFDVFVHAPRLEAFGLVVAEAMAAELPVVATSVGGVPEIVRDGQTGTLVPPDAPAALAQAIAALVDSPQRRRQWARAGRQAAAEHFSVSLQVSRYAELYQRLCAGLGPDPAGHAAENVPSSGAELSGAIAQT